MFGSEYDSLAQAAVIFGIIMSGSILGLIVGRFLPDHHLTKETQDTVKVAVGMVAAMSSLVLGLMTAEVKSSFDTIDREVKVQAARLLQVDLALRKLGTAEALKLRQGLFDYAVATRDVIWNGADKRADRLFEAVYGQSLAINPTAAPEAVLANDVHRLINDIGEHRIALAEQMGGSISRPFLVVMVAWVVIIFASWSLFAPRNLTVMISLMVCSASIAGALFLILEMDSPFGGLITVGDSAFTAAIRALGKP